IPRELLEPEDDELGGLQGGEAYEDVDHAAVDVGLGGGLVVALDEVGLRGCGALEGALAEEGLQERADGDAQPGPEGLVVGLEDGEAGAAVEGLLQEQGEAADGDVLVLVAELVVAAEGPGAPDDAAGGGEGAEAVHAQGVEQAVLGVGQLDGEGLD